MIKFYKQFFIFLVIILGSFSCGQQNVSDTTPTLEILEETVSSRIDSEDYLLTLIPSSTTINGDEENIITTENDIFTITTDTSIVTPEAENIVTETNPIGESRTEYFKPIFPIKYGTSGVTENANVADSSQSTITNEEDVSLSTVTRNKAVYQETEKPFEDISTSTIMQSSTDDPPSETMEPTEYSSSGSPSTMTPTAPFTTTPTAPTITTREPSSSSTSPYPTEQTTPVYIPDWCLGDGETALDVVPSTFSIYLNWSNCNEPETAPTKGQYYYKIIYNDTTESTHAYSINLTKNIQSCTTYSGVIEFINEESDQVISCTSFTNNTLPEVDPVQNLNLKEDNENSEIIITWSPSERSKNCVNTYLFEIFEDNISIIKMETKYPELRRWNIDGCKDHLYKISAMYDRNKISEPKTITYSNISLNEAPIFVDMNITENKNVFIWWKFGKICKPLNFFVKCQFDNIQPIETKGTFNLTENLLTVQLLQLEPYQNYSCQGRIENAKGNSSWSEKVNFETLPSEPEKPETLNIYQNENDTSFHIAWKPPRKWNGKEIEYKLTVKLVRPTFHLPDRCTDDFPFNNMTTNPNSSEIEYPFTEAYASMEYVVCISAISSGGEGPASKKRFVTLEQVPKQPDNLEISEHIFSLENIYNVSMNVYWLMPCKINGNLSNYTLKVVDPSDNIYIETTIEYCQECQYNFPAAPDKKYDVKIQANLEILEGEIGEISTVSSAGIPVVPSKNNWIDSNPTDNENSESSVRLYIPEDLFDKTMGQIIYYAIIVAGEGCEESSKTGRYDVNEWPVLQGKNNCTEEKVYEATPKRWNPFDNNLLLSFKVATTVNYTLGNSSCTESNYCNHYLTPDTNYTVKIRGFTKNGFCDTNLEYFRTTYVINLGLILGLVVGILVIACLIAAVLFYTKGKLNFKNWPRMDSSQPISPAPLPVLIKKFPSRFAKMNENPGKIKNEFQLLSTISSDVTLSTKNATLPINRKKNRYINILPYDQTRVQLIDVDPNSSDYINASYIKGYSGNNEYIATQGPTENTSPAFWQMVMERNVRLIVMLTQFVENGKEKCYKYFPDKSEDYVSNGIKIQCIEETIKEIYNRRIFRVVKGTTSKKIVHVQFNMWPDFGVPSEIEHMIDFCRTVKDLNKRKPGLILIHCSAGVGRTGTLIAVDILLQNIRDKRKVDIFGTVLNLRKQRTTMVQSERQYEFLYRCINYVITKSDIQQSKTQLDHITENQISESNNL